MGTTHKRIRPFNTKDTYPEQNLDNDLCQAVVAGGVVYLRGQIGQDLDTRESVGIGDVAVQTEKAMSNIAMLLDEAGSSLRGHRQGRPCISPTSVIAKPCTGSWATGSKASTRSRPGLVVERTRPPRMARGDRRHRSHQRGQEVKDTAEMTFSLVARDEATGAFGIVICSSSPAVAARCVHVRATVGVVASQNITNPALGPRVLDSLAGGSDADTALKAALAQEQFPDYRQLTVVDVHGNTAVHSGANALGVHTHAQGDQAVAAGNLLECEEVISELLAGYADSAAAAFEERLLDGLRAALAAGGEAGPVHSAGLLVVEDVPWPVTDLRIDHADDPVGDLAELWQLWKPQKDDYRVRGLDPTRAPSYGVPGDT